MARKAKAETALVQRKVVDAEFVEDSGVPAALADTVQSLTAQNLALNELLVESYKTMLEEKKSVAGIVDNCLARQIELTEQREKLLDKRQERKLRQDKEEAQQELASTAIHEVLALLPVLAAKFSGQPLLDRKEAAMIQPFVSSFSQDQIQKFFGILSQAQQAAFVEILKALPDMPDGQIKDPSNGAH